MQKTLIYILGGFLIFMNNSCYEIETYPPEPQVEFISFELKDTIDLLENRLLSGTLVFSFIDGDGDIGQIQNTDTLEPEKDIFLELYKKIDGEFIKEDLSVPYEYTLPYFESGPNNPTLRGEISIKDINFYFPFKEDTLKFEFYIKDRNSNMSNIDETNTFILSKYAERNYSVNHKTPR